MAYPARSKSLYKSMLPTIVCSTCGDDIEISMIGDHTCSMGGGKEMSDAHLQRLDHERVPAVPNVPPIRSLQYNYVDEDFEEDHSGTHYSDQEHHSYQYQHTPGLDHEYADGHAYEHEHEHEHEHDHDLNLDTAHDYSPAYENSLENRDPSTGAHEAPHTDTTPQQQTPAIHEPLSPRLTSPQSFSRPMKAKPPPVDAAIANRLNVQQDESHLITASSIATAPSPMNLTTFDDSGHFPPRTASANDSLRFPSSPGYAPLSPRPAVGANVMKRMDSIASGPFSKRGIASDIELLTPGKPEPVRLDSNEVVSIGDADPSQLPLGPPPPRPDRPEHVEGLTEALNEVGKEPLIDPNKPNILEGITIVPEQNSEALNLKQVMARSTRSSRSSNYGDEPSEPTNELRPGAPPSRFSQMLPESSFEPDEADKTPQPDTGLKRKLTNRLRNWTQRHAPTESNSSSGSKTGAFDDSAASSRSSPPTSNGDSFSPRQRSLENIGGIASAHNVHLPRKLSTESATSSGSVTANFSRPRAADHLDPVIEIPDRSDSRIEAGASPSGYPFPLGGQREPSEKSSIPSPIDSPLDSPMPSAARSPAFEDYPSPDLSPPISPPASLPVRSHSLRQPKLPDTRPPIPKTKGTCRGCSKPITGKAVKAADGRLTGRWHRECFVCKTCRRQFATADFYVINNNPYCAHHYHVLNHSLCYSCNRGIEGEYAETQEPNPKLRQKYHLDCFRCNDCGQGLYGDYFEMNGRFYCERDVRRNYDDNNLLAPGRKFPERRRTKLMMM